MAIPLPAVSMRLLAVIVSSSAWERFITPAVKPAVDPRLIPTPAVFIRKFTVPDVTIEDPTPRSTVLKREVRLDAVIAPLFTKLPSDNSESKEMDPVVLNVASAPMVNTPVPVSRLVKSASWSLVIAVKPKPPLRIMSSLIEMLRPACNVKPPFPAFPEASIASSTVISLLACRVTFAPFSASTTSPGAKVTSTDAIAVNRLLTAIASVPPVAIIIFLGSNKTVPFRPWAALKSTDPR